jgi:hypothetical protein
MEWEEQNVVKSSIAKLITHESMPNSVAQNYPMYYVDMLIVFIIINPKYVFLTKNIVKTLE